MRWSYGSVNVNRVALLVLALIFSIPSASFGKGGAGKGGKEATTRRPAKAKKNPSEGMRMPKNEHMPKPERQQKSTSGARGNSPRPAKGTSKQSAAGRRSLTASRSARVQSVSTWNIDAPRREVLQLALQAYTCGDQRGQFDQPYLTIIDYSLPSSVPRLWVIDVHTRRILRNELVAHGRNSGDDLAVAFSNDPHSMQSSIGLFRTEDVYRGRHGESLRLVGLEPGINDRAEERKIVMHGAWYVSAAHAARYGQLGRSLGCPALPLGVHRQIIDRIKGGSAVFVYYPDDQWLRSSSYLHCDARLAAS